MFKFMKSKKGFTLVELMIVVVIMAILVAVAVPIYNAVTENARKKTCIGNQRQIISSIGNWLMSNEITTMNAEISITNTNGTLAFAASATDKGTDTISDAQYTAIKGLFKTVPGCPEAGKNIKVTISPASGANAFSTCAVACDNTAHKLETNS